MAAILSRERWVNTLRPRQNGRHFADDIFKCIFLSENVWKSIEISLRFDWNNDGKFTDAYIYASLGLNELRDLIAQTVLAKVIIKHLF